VEEVPQMIPMYRWRYLYDLLLSFFKVECYWPAKVHKLLTQWAFNANTLAALKFKNICYMPPWLKDENAVF
jgi:hypothetical protein